MKSERRPVTSGLRAVSRTAEVPAHQYSHCDEVGATSTPGHRTIGLQSLGTRFGGEHRAFCRATLCRAARCRIDIASPAPPRARRQADWLRDRNRFGDVGCRRVVGRATHSEMAPHFAAR